jgi:hypothetical protein
MQQQEGKSIPLPAVIAAIVVVVGIAVFAVMQFMQPTAGGTAEATAIANDIKASPGTAVIPKETVMAEVVNRGAPGTAPGPGAGMMGGVKKNAGR